MEKPLPVVMAPTSIEFALVRRATMPWVKAGKLAVAQCGMGPKLASAFGASLDKSQFSSLILIGWAGGLVSNLKAGDVVCADGALQQGQVSINCKTIPILTASTGPILTVSRALATPEEKRDAQASGALAVEMEAYPLARKAQQLGIPFFHVRIILDAIDESIPDLGQGATDDGKLRMGPFLFSILRNPGLIKELWQFNRRIQMLNPLLAKLAVEICQQCVDDGKIH